MVAEFGALPNSGKTYFIPQIGSSDCVQFLLSHGFMEDIGCSHIRITVKGRNTCLSLTETVSGPHSLLDFAREPLPDADEMTKFELMLALSKNGWTDSADKKSKSIEPYKPGSAKVWYHGSGSFPQVYLRVLLAADDFFQKGVSCIHHFQINAYYDALLRASTEQLLLVLPNQVLADYKRIFAKSKQHILNLEEERGQLLLNNKIISFVFVSILSHGRLVLLGGTTW